MMVSAALQDQRGPLADVFPLPQHKACCNIGVQHGFGLHHQQPGQDGQPARVDMRGHGRGEFDQRAFQDIGEHQIEGRDFSQTRMPNSEPNTLTSPTPLTRFSSSTTKT